MTMQLQSPPPASEKKDPKKKFLAFGAFSASTIFHLLLLFLVGGTVLIQGIIPKAKFESTIEPTPTITDVPDEVPDAEKDPTEVPPIPMEAVEIPTPSVESIQVPDMITTDSLTPLQNHIPPPPVITPTTQPNDTPKPETNDPSKPKVMRSMTSFFGDKEASTDSISGFLYDLKQTADRKESDLAEDKDPKKNDVDSERKRNAEYVTIINDFLKNWNESVLQKYYKTKFPLSTSQIFIPLMAANEAPKAFDVDRYVKPKRWIIHYKGEYTPTKTGTFRFVGLADDVIVVRFNREVVLNGSLTGLDVKVQQENLDKSPTLGRMYLKAGPWIKLHAGQSYPIEVLLGELPGGVFYGFLMLQEQGVTYPTRPNGSPILPLFQTTPTKIPKFDAEKTAPMVADPAKS